MTANSSFSSPQTDQIEANKVSIPKTALVLGYMGLIPFVILSLSLWFVGPAMSVPIASALLLYAAIILSFMGAVYWGVAIAGSATPDSRLLLLSVIPPLIGWFASFTGDLLQYSVLYIAFAGLCVLDTQAAKKGDMPPWYPHLRVPLTVIVIASLINAQLAHVIV